MYKPITVSRATIGNGILNPLKVSQNSQIAINNSTFLTILEPKLPSLAQCRPGSGDGADLAHSFDPSVFFDARSVFHVENLESLGFQIFSQILIEDHEKRFNFSRIAEPQIVAHDWSPVSPSTRECYLGILLNTGEVMVLKRDSLDAANWKVHFRSFTSLLDQMRLSQNRLNSEGDIILSGAQFQHLKITSFTFGSYNSSLLVLLAHESGQISLHGLAEGLLEISSFQADGLVVSMLWSDSTVYYVLNDNSVWSSEYDFDMGTFSTPEQLLGPSRFLVSQLRSTQSKSLVITDTRGIHVVSKGKARFQELPFRSAITGLEVEESGSTITCAIFFETGRLCVATCSKNNISLDTNNQVWSEFCTARLKATRDDAVREQNKAPSRAFQPYLEAVPEVGITIFGSTLIPSSGLVAVTHAVATSATITHVTKSKKEYGVSFVPVSALLGSVGESERPESALAHLNSLLAQTLVELPQLTKSVLDGDEEAIKTFIAACVQWKDKNLIEATTELDSNKGSPDLAVSLEDQFRSNTSVNAFQSRYLFNIALTRSLRAIAAQIEPSTSINESLLQLAQEQDAISLKIRSHLARIVTSWAQSQAVGALVSAADIFIVSAYQALLQSQGISDSAPISTDAGLTITSALCTETFPVQSGPLPADFLEFAESTSKHKWTRCDLTMLPIVDLVNKTDETETHKYVASALPESVISKVLVEQLSYCIFTGTRTFSLKVGV